MISKRRLDSVIRNALNDKSIELSNAILYKMCQDYPSNTDKDSVLAKSLIIGRVYSASLERGIGKKKTSGSSFYKKEVFPKVSSFFSKPDVISQLQSFKKALDYSTAVEVHGKFVTSLYGLRNSNKVSFASKYLHFHYPNQFYIYDSRARKAIGILNYHFNDGRRLRKEDIIVARSLNENYLSFMSKCKKIRDILAIELKNDKLTIRDFDTILIGIADSVK